MTDLAGWANFYVVIGAAAGALIGLQFVVIALVSQRPSARIAEAGAAFGTPTIVHFAAALLLSAVLCAPWRSIAPAAVLWGALGIGGAAYLAIVIRRMSTQGVYRPVLEDWLFHAVLPAAAYASLALSAFIAPAHARGALFAVGAASLVLLFAGIHNAWDAVIYHLVTARRE